MNEKKNVSLTVVILNYLCAVLWTVNCVVVFAYGEVDMLKILCAVVWWVCAAVWTVRYRKSKEQE